MIEWITNLFKALWYSFTTCPMLTILYTLGGIFLLWFICDLPHADANPKKTDR